MRKPLAPGATIGILGGGQLGRMLCLAAARLGLKCHIYEPAENPPAAQVAHRLTTAAYDDKAALRAFAGAVDVITYEFENIPTDALDVLEKHAPIHPGRRALAISQDRLREKEFLQSLGLATAPFAAIESLKDLETAMARIGTPAILKTRRLGYDGKGQVRLADADEAPKAHDSMKGAPAVLEGFVDFSSEVSVICATDEDGANVCYDPGENIHENGILHKTTVPAPGLNAATALAARHIAKTISQALDYIGILAVELFVTDAGLVVNEIAPRVHNSGHWTQDGSITDQFEQHIRAVAGWPLGDGRRHSIVEMTNLIGNDVSSALAYAAIPDTCLHLYGKAEIRPGRKMGHVNRIISPDS